MALTQSHFRFGIDELAENTHGWHAAEDADTSIAVTTTFLLRFCVQADATGLANVDYEFQYNKNGAGWVNITTSSSVVKAVATTALVSGNACTQRLSGTGTFTGGSGQTEDGTSGGTNHDIVNSGTGETECSLQVNAGTVTPGDQIQFRLTRDVGNLLDTYAVTPTLTVAGDPPVPPRTLAALFGLVLLAWQPMAPVPLPRVEIAATIEQAVADAPPVRDRRILTRIIAQWWKPILHGTSGGAAPVVADAPPPKSDALPRILASWAPAAPPIPRRSALIPGSVDPPPPRTSVTPAIVAASWLPPPPFPYRPAPLVQGAPTVGNDPPFDGRRSAFGPIYQSWKWRPVGAGTASAEIVNDPPFGAPSAFDQVFASWATPAPRPESAAPVAALPGISVDPPPVIGTAPADMLASVAAAWVPAPPLPPRAGLLSPGITGQSVDPPPVRKRDPRAQEIGWQPAPLQVVSVSRLVFESSDNPPFGLAKLADPIYAAWLPAPPAPQWGRHVVPISEVAGAPPPFDQRRSAFGPIYAAWKWRPVGSGDSPPVAPDVPLPRRPEQPILSAWQLPPAAPQWGRHVPVAEAQADAPPFGIRPWLLVTLGGWQLPPPLPWRPTWLAQGGVAAVDAPPSGLDTALSPILSAWQPSFVLPPRRAVQVPAEVAPELPPSGHPALPIILAAWQPPASLPLLRGLLSPGIPGQSVDPPPIGFRLPLRWPPPPPDPPQPRAQIATLPGVSVDPPSPSSRAIMATLRAAWEPGPPAAQWGRHVPPSVAHVPVNDPPFGIRPWLPTVRARWEPGPPAPLLRLVVATESGPVNQVDFIYAGPITMSGAGAGAGASQLAGSGRITSQRAGGGPITGDGG